MASIFTSKLNLALLVVAIGSLLAGVASYPLHHGALARQLWGIGVLPMLGILLYDTAGSLLQRKAGVDFLALLSILLALFLGEMLTASVISLMLASGRALEDYASSQAQREMSALLQHAPRFAHRFQDGEWRKIDIKEIAPGNRLLVRNGEVVPADGNLLTPAQLDESALTGEPLPIGRAAGEAIASGALNAGQPFELLATSSSEHSTFAGILRLMHSAQQQQSPSARLADRYALLFIPLTLFIALFAWLVSNDLNRVLAVLVVATPCPLILAVPVAIVSGMSSCAKRGVLVKSGAALERLAQANSLFFDKTGTLTGGHARLAVIQVSSGIKPDNVLWLAASLEQACNHVLAESIVTAARERAIALALPHSAEEAPGAGISGDIAGHRVAVGSYDFVSSQAIPAPWSPLFLQRLAYEGASGVFVSMDGVMVGALQLVDKLRLDTPRALRRLALAGLGHIVMLTGDRKDIAGTLGNQLGVSEVLAEQTPADKLTAIRRARESGIVVMVGDGVNDAPALAAADVGVAMGARGAAAAAEAADVVLLVDRLDRLVEALHMARRARRIAAQSVILGMGLSIAAMLAAATGNLTPIAGALLQEIIDVAAILNALRARRVVPGNGSHMTAQDAEQLSAEHRELESLLSEVSQLADRLPDLAGPQAVKELGALSQSLSEHLLPHEQQEDHELYPELARQLGGDDPMAAMSGTHREIFRITRLLDRMIGDLPADGPSPPAVQELQRLLYGLDAILHLHFAQEEELYHSLSAPT
ncbi:heavy metal translocating P-type ATPase [Vogesella sp. LIG4]|uniref:heavy metal translocating P-type ATPase n=1 Tax=Vogesella sp. LIG4 TaxID=1192162 RepID=UPI00082010D5|nr:heavy metal translocating P-type ATPase [Vogesella sp. LIG4]SCK26539.1 ATPase, P-type (transporting), HAD superfamily, subfamily IC/heavy metal translocating P-type ATPase [Vogesella sp. LIG4]